MARKIGFIGMGIMGVPMASNLLKKGFDVTVYNRTREKTEPLAEAGATVAEAPGGFKDAEVVILMLTGPEAIDAIMKDGLLECLSAGQVLVNMSSVPPGYTRILAQNAEAAGAEFVDAPVSGSKLPAETGELVILAGGKDEVIDSVEPVLLAMGKKVVRCGPAGNGSAMKMSVNLVLGVMVAGLAEGLSLAEHCGVAPDTFYDTILAGPLNCGLFNMKRELLVKDEFPAQFPLKHMEKDMRFIQQTAGESGAALPVGGAAAIMYGKSLQCGLGDEDFSAVKKLVDQLGRCHDDGHDHGGGCGCGHHHH